jgi:hypothetical protein
MDHGLQLTRLLGEFERLDIIPSGADLSTVRGLLNVLKSNKSAQYAPNGRANARMVLFRAEEPIAYKGQIEDAEADMRETADFGWTPFSTLPIETISVPGDHVTMLASPNAAVLAKHWQACLDNLKLAPFLLIETAQPETVSC